MLDIQHLVPNVLLKDASFLLEHVVPAWMVRVDPYNALLEADYASSLESVSEHTANPSYLPLADQQRDFMASSCAALLRHPGLKKAETSCN